MTHRPTVLIAGASIAGPALAFWLERYGWSPTVVERSPEFRTGGQNIDVRGAARQVLRRAGLEDTVRRATTGERGTRFLGEHGRVVAEFPRQRSDTAGATAEVEVLRGDLARILVDATAGTDYRFGDRVTCLDDTASDVLVTFASGKQERFDLVVAADGLRSSTRALILGPGDVTIRPLGMEMTNLTIPRRDDDTDWWYWYSAPGGRSVTLRPDRHGTTRAVLAAIRYDRPTGGADGQRSTKEQVERLRRQFDDVGWQARRVLDALDDAEDLYFETLAQVKAARWTRGRVALVGDAAWCATPVSGMGTSLSIVGAYVLAGEIAAHVDHRDAFAGYERIMRPYVDQAQHLPPGVPRIANPRTRAGIQAFHLALRLAATPVASRAGARFFTPRRTTSSCRTTPTSKKRAREDTRSADVVAGGREAQAETAALRVIGVGQIATVGPGPAPLGLKMTFPRYCPARASASAYWSRANSPAIGSVIAPAAMTFDSWS